jgi:hypothetical protein
MPFTVNGELVEDSSVRAEMRALRPRYEAMARGLERAQAEAQLHDWSRENIVERVLLRQHAVSDPEPIPQEALEEALRSMEPGDEALLRKEVEIRLRIERVLVKATAKVSPPRHREVTEYYRKNKEQFRTAEGIQSFDQVKETIEKGLHERKKQRAVENFLDHLKAKAVIEETLLP